MRPPRRGDAASGRRGGRVREAAGVRRVGGSDRGGFVLAVVVFVIFAVGLAGTAAYQLVRLEADLSGQGRDGERALSVARAGLERFLGAHYGIPPDSTDFMIGSGTAAISTRRVAEMDSVTDLYHIRSVGVVPDSRWADSPARRVVSQYALLHKDPVGIHAALLVAAGNVRVRNGGRVDGDDQARSGDCPVGGGHDRIGIANTGNVSDQGGGTIQGDPDHASFGSFNAIYDSARVRWDVLESPDFGIAHDGSPPVWSSVPPDSFPVVRATEDLVVSSSWSGRGVLIVPGELDIGSPFTWDGIILAGSLGTMDSNQVTIRGLIVGGLDGQQGNVQIRHVDIRYHGCNAFAASAALAYFEPLENTFFEGT